MTRRSALAFALLAPVAVLLAIWCIPASRRAESGVAVAANADARAQRVAELERALQQRDAEVGELRDEIARLRGQLAEQREAADRSKIESDSARATALVPETAKPASDDLDAAVHLLRRLLPDSLGHLTAEGALALTTLDLRGTNVTDADLAALAALPALKSLTLRGTAVTDAGLASLRSLPELAVLDLRETKVSGDGLAALPANRLEALHLTNTQVKGEDMRRLPLMPNLKVLKLNGLDVKDEDLRDLPLLPSLEHLELDQTRISEQGLRGLIDENPGLKRIELRYTSITPEAVAAIQEQHPNVELVLASGSIGPRGY